MSKKFGLDISDYSVEVLELGFNKKAKKFARILLEPGIIENGKIINKQELAEKIKQAVKKARIRTKKVVFSLPESRVFIHFFEKQGNILEQSKKIIPLDQDNIYFDIKENLYVACSKRVIDSYVETLKLAGLVPVAAEPESLSLARSLNAKNCLILDIGARTANLSIFDQAGRLRLSAAIDIAGNRFTQSLSSKMDISLKMAEKLKKKYGLDQTKKNERVMLILQKELQELIKEVKEAVSFYQGEIKQIILAGGSAKMPKIADYFFSNVGVKTFIAKSLASKLLKGKSGLFNVAAGLALRGVDLSLFDINLMPSRKLTASQKISLCFLIIFVALSLVFLAWVIYLFVFLPG